MRFPGNGLLTCCRIAVLMGGCFFAQEGRAQTPPADIFLPGSVDPGRALENNRLRSDPSEGLEEAAPERRATAVIPEGIENLIFTLHELSVDGMTAYAPDDIRPLYAGYIGKEISVAKLFEIMTALQQKYYDDGYALTKVVIPNQDIEGGNVHLAAIEGHVREVEVDAAIPPSHVIDNAVMQIHSMRPLNMKTLERIMLILNDMPDLNVSAVLTNPTQQSQAGEGAVRLILKHNEGQDARVSVTADNHGSVFSGPLQIKASASRAHAGPNYSELSVSGMMTVPYDEQHMGSANYTLPLFGVSGTKLSVYASRASSEPGASLSTLDIKGLSDTVGANISYPVIRQRDMTLTLDAALELKNSRTKILGEELYDDRLRVAKLGANFNFSDGWAGYNVFDLHYSHGFDILGARKTGSENLSRLDGKSDFGKTEMMAGRLQGLPANFELLAMVTGQYAHDTLLSSEEFGFGGGQVGRGYDPSEITGDHGVAASFELRYRTDAKVFKTVLALQPYAFYDIGKVWNIDAGAKDNVSAASAGAGMRTFIGNEWSLDLNFAKPLTKSAENEPKYQNDVGARVLFSVSRSF